MKAGVLLALFVLGPVGVAAEVPGPSVQHAEVPLDLANGRDTSAEVNLLLTAGGLQVGALGQSGVLVTQPLEVPLAEVAPFLAVSAVWTAENATPEAVSVAVRASPDGEVWSDWQPIRPDHDVVSGTPETFGGLVYLPKDTKLLQFRVALPYQDALPAKLTAFRAVFISPGDSPDPSPEPEVAPIESLAVSKPSVVSRTSWGCPDGQSSPQWTPQYTTVSHLIVHHTDNSNSSTDWPAVVRSIHTFHKVTNGWGDIGYNYLVDPNGVIYEGRAGGDDVIGAHFSCANGGTMGVAFLGTFTSVQPTSSAWSSVTRLLAWKADQRGIDPHGVAYHSGTQLNLNRISGHRDANSSPNPNACPSGTVCPGSTLYSMFGTLRDDVADLIDPPDTPGNDSCGNATTLASNTSCNYTAGTVLDATASGVARPSCDPQSTNLFDVWYRFTAQATSHTVTVDPDGVDGDPVVALYGSCGSSQLACEDNGQGVTETMTVSNLSPGSTYYIRVYDYGSQEPTGSNATFRICVTHTQTNYTIALSASPPSGGTVSGAGTFAAGSLRTVTASPNSGYDFDNWTEDGDVVSSNPSYQFTLNENRTLVANFTEQPVTDTTPPSGSILINSGAQYASSTNVSLSLSATDAVGVTGYYTSSSSSTPSPGAGGWVSVGPATSFNTNAGFALPAGDGAKTVYAWFRDAAGNLSARSSDSITVDQTAPSDGSLTAMAGIQQVTLSWSGQSDATSGVASTKLVFALGSTAPANCSGSALATSSPYTHSGLTPGQPYSYRVCATDSAGNTSAGATASATPQGGTGLQHVRNDVNGDERADVFWRNTSTGQTSMWFMNGTGYSGTALGPTVPLAGWLPAVAGDFDGDGRTDFFWRNASTGQTSIWLGWNGSAFASLVTGVTIPVEWVPLMAGDIDGDDRADIFWRNANTGETSIWFMNGAVYSRAIRSTTVPTSWFPTLSGDFDGDGDTDLFWRNPSTGETSLWMNWNGSAFSTQVRSVTAGTTWIPIGAGDVSGDGSADIFWRNASTGQNSLWVMNGAAAPAFTTLTTVPTSWGAVAFGDYDGDIRTDVFWRNSTTGETSVWLGYNGTTFTTQAPSTTAPTAWVPFHSR